MSAILQWLKLRDYKYGVEVTFSGMTSLVNFADFYFFVVYFTTFSQ
jgi:hypothetical protein